MSSYANFQVQSLSSEQQPALAKFYKRNQYKGKVKASDRIWVMTNGDDQIIGAARLCLKAGFTLLRGFWIDREFRSKGVGSQLLQYLKCAGALDSCYCFPYLYLEVFYAKHGFNRVEQVPVALQPILERYNRKETQVLLMIQPS